MRSVLRSHLYRGADLQVDRDWGVRLSLLVMMVLVLASLTLASSAGAASFGLAPGASGALSGPQAGQAGAPGEFDVSFALNTVDPSDPTSAPVGTIRDLVTELPAGLIANPTGVPECGVGNVTNLASLCPTSSAVGSVAYRIYDPAHERPFPPVPLVFHSRLYRVKAQGDEAAAFAFSVFSAYPVRLSASVDPSNGYRIKTTVINAQESMPLMLMQVTLWGVPQDHQAPGPLTQLGGGSYGNPEPDSVKRTRFLSVPTRCTGGPFATTLTATSWQTGIPIAPVTDAFPASAITGCDQLTFNPLLSVTPSVKQAAVPSGYQIDLEVPQNDDPYRLATPNLKDATVALPVGVTLSPSAAHGLQACTDGQLMIDAKADESCPAASKIGDLTIDTPLLDDPVLGSVYVGQQLSDDPESGRMFRIFLTAKAPGVKIKLRGAIRLNPATGQITATFLDNPQLPFSKLSLTLKDGPRAPLVNPSVCGTVQTASTFTSWGGQSVDTTSPVRIDRGCGSRFLFGPVFGAGTVNPMAGVSSPFVLRVAKPDGQADLNQLAMVLPEGLLGNLKGNMGRRVGTARVAAGAGSSPFWLSGPVVLEGPYKGAPFSLKVTVPAVAGPFNLGNVTVRQRIYVDSHDAHVTVVSDPLPTIVKGVPVDLQSLAVDIDKAGFMRNPTSCAPKVIGGTLGSVRGQYVPVASRFQVGSCANLPLEPKLSMGLTGKDQTKRGEHPSLSATLTQQPGESALKKVKVRLPLSLALDPDNAQALCKPGQAAAHRCPAGSIVGHATAVTPMLDQPLSGNVYFVEGTRKSKTGRTVKTLPKLWVALRGQVAIDLWADSAIGKNKALVTTFGFVPDAPISSFRLDITGGDHGILAVTGDSDANLCQSRLITDATFDGQNGKRATDKVRMGSPCGFGIRDKSLSKTHAKVTVSGIGAGKLSISGKGIHKASRTIKHSEVATIRPRLTEAGQKAYRDRKALRLKVTWNPKAKGEKTRSARTTVKRAQASSSRAHRRSHRSR